MIVIKILQFSGFLRVANVKDWVRETNSLFIVHFLFIELTNSDRMDTIQMAYPAYFA